MTEPEIELAGGNVNDAVVRVGATVRRRLTPAGPAVHALLRHLERKGFSGSPRFRGIDGQGREILTFLEGETGIPAAIWETDAPLVAAATLLRSYHEATVDFVPPPDAAWAYAYPDPRRHEVICHNDFAPYNMIFTDGCPHAVIDFDLAGPGPRLRDVAYAVYWMTPLSLHSADQVPFAQADLAQGSRRCRLFCDTYGITITPALFDMIDEVLAHMGDEAHVARVVGVTAADRLKREGHLAHWQQEAAAFRQARPRLEANLC